MALPAQGGAFFYGAGEHDIKKELLSFYLYGLNSKSEKDFERKIKQFVNRREIDIDGYGR